MSVASASGIAEGFEVGRVVSRTFGALSRNLVLFLGFALIFDGVPRLLGGLWGFLATSHNDSGSAPLATAVIGLLAFLGSTVLPVATTRATVSDLVGERPDFAACVKAGLKLFLPMLGLTIYSGIAIALASLLLLVPGIILYVAWSVAVPCYVQERVGISASLERSGSLTKGARWKIFAILLVWWVVSSLPKTPLEMPMNAAHVPAYAQALITSFIDVVLSMVLATLQATIYVELRDVKEGVSPKDLEAIFA